MCLPIAAAAGTAAAFSNTMAVVGTVISVASTGLGIFQAQQQANMQAAQAAQQNNLAYQQQQRAAFNARQQQVLKHIGDVKAQQIAALSYQKQVFNNNEAANRVFTAEQLKLMEARGKAAFKAQDILAKSIGATGRVLATGATGQSVGLLAMDAERQAGFALAEQNATLRSAEMASGMAQDQARIESQSANNTAFSRVPFPVQAPLLEPDPVGIGTNLQLGVPSYNWA